MSNIRLRGIMLGSDALTLLWNEEFECLTDYMGLPISRDDAFEIMAEIDMHMEKTDEEIAAIREAVMQSRYPAMQEHLHEEKRTVAKGKKR